MTSIHWTLKIFIYYVIKVTLILFLSNHFISFLKEKLRVLDRTMALYGPRTQAYEETNYLKEKLRVLDRTKALYGPRTQAYRETNYLKEFWTEPRHCMVLGLGSMRKPTT